MQNLKTETNDLTGWENTTLGKVGKIITGNTPPTSNRNYYNDAYLPWITPPDLGDGVRLKGAKKYLSKTGAGVARVLPKGAVLISCIGNLGKVGIAETELATNQQINSVVFNDKVLPEYGFYYCLTLKKWLNENSSATTIAIINKGRLENAPFLLASIEKQKQIVEDLNAVIPNTPLLVAKINKAKKLVAKFRQAILSAAITGKLTEDWRLNNGLDAYDDVGNPSGWVNSTIIKTLIPKGIFDGPFGSNLKTEDYTDSGVRVIRLENVGFLELIDDKKTYISEEKYQSLKKHTVHESDLIFSSFIADKVRCVVLPKLDDVAVAKADCFCLRPNKDVADVHFLAYLLSSKQIYNALVSFTHGATRPRINTTQLRNLEILLPPLKEQKEIVRMVKQYFDVANEVEKQIEKAEARVSKLTQAILAKTFRSE